MKEIKIIKLVSFLLFLIPISALLFILLTTNHLVSYERIYYPNGIQKEQKFKCNESNNLCSDITGKPIKLTECSLKKFKQVYCLFFSKDTFANIELIHSVISTNFFIINLCLSMELFYL